MRHLFNLFVMVGSIALATPILAPDVNRPAQNLVVDDCVNRMAGELMRDTGARVPFTMKLIVAAPESLAGQAKIIESRATAECINRLAQEFAGKTGVKAPFAMRLEIEPMTAGR